MTSRFSFLVGLHKQRMCLEQTQVEDDFLDEIYVVFSRDTRKVRISKSSFIYGGKISNARFTSQSKNVLA